MSTVRRDPRAAALLGKESHMVRTAMALLIGALLAAPGAARAAEALAGNWKVTILNSDQPQTLWLIQLENKDGKWTGSVLAVAERVPKFTMEGLAVTSERVRFTLKTGDQAFTFDCKPPKQGAKVVKGSIAQDGQMVPCELEATALKTLDPYEISKELLADKPDDPGVFSTALRLLSVAGEKKAKPEEVRGWAEKAWKAAEPYGTRWQQEMAVRIAEVLTNQEGFAQVALPYAQRAERLLEPKDQARTKQRVYSVYAQTLEKAGKADEAKEMKERVAKQEKEIKAEQAKQEAKADAEYLKSMPPFKVLPFEGRKAKSDRAVLVELFTNAQTEQCAAADLAFEGLGKTYKPSDAILLSYHVHVRGASDPLVSPDSLAREDYYDDNIKGLPTIFFNGKAEESGGGAIEDSGKIYGIYRKNLEPLLDKPAQAKLTISAARKGSKIEISSEASGVENPGDHLRLRLALVEARVRYAGANGIRYHNHVVRALPGGENGIALRDKTTRHSTSVDLEGLIKSQSKYLAEVIKKSRTQFPSADQLVELKDLRLVAFAQNDKTKEILQAVQVEVRGEKE
jgi:hypothetical protein